MAERVTTSPNRQSPSSISADGRQLIVMEDSPKTGWDLSVLPLPPAPGKTPEPLLHTTATEVFGEVSPDGHWFAYQSDESGQNQIWVRPFPNVDGGHWQVSTSGGISPVWSRNGKELFFLDNTDGLIRVLVQTAPTFSAGPPEKLFGGPYYGNAGWRTYDVAPDGRFLMIKSGDRSSAATTIVVALNWLEELKQRVPVP